MEGWGGSTLQGEEEEGREGREGRVDEGCVERMGMLRWRSGGEGVGGGRGEKQGKREVTILYENTHICIISA